MSTNRTFTGKRITAGAGVIIVAALLFMAGPRARVVPPAANPAIPADVDAYLNAEESAVPRLKDWAKKRVYWNGARGRKTSWAVVFIHGFSASRAELSPVCERIAASLHANLFMTRLAGHGSDDGDSMANVTAGDWMMDAREALAVGHRLGDRVAVIGSSTGATLALWLGLAGAGADALVLYSPNFGVADRRARLLVLPWGLQIGRALAGRYVDAPASSPAMARNWTTRYRMEGVVQMEALSALVSGMDLKALRTPVLVVYTPHDRVVDTGRIIGAYGGFGSPVKQLIRLEAAPGHVLGGDIRSPLTTGILVKYTTDFLDRL